MDMKGLSPLEQKQGLVHLYVGDGKGKTTAAAGLALRALGQGKRVLFTQYLKGRATGELAPLERLGAQVRRAACGEKFTFQLSEEEMADLRASHRECLAQTARDAAQGGFDLIVMDEAVDAVNCGAIPLEELLALLEGRAPQVEVVLTGRNPPPGLAAAADYHTDFCCRRHPYQKGIPSRRGIEY